MNAHKGHEGLMVSGALAALAFSADGLPRRARGDVGLVARRSAAHVGGQVEHRLSALAARVPYARSREEQIDLRIKALRAEQLGLRFGPDRIEAHLRDLLREHPKADHFTAGAFGPNLIVNTGEGYLVDAWQNLVPLTNMRYHGVGTGTNAAAETDADLQIASTTALNPDSVRATGSIGEASQSVFRTAGTLTFDAITAVTEWGLFSQQAIPGGVMWSRIVFASIPAGVGDSVLFTYDLTIE